MNCLIYFWKEIEQNIMEKFVRLIAIILLLSTTTLFVIKIIVNIPISHRQLLIIFIVGIISFFWANWREGRKEKKK